MRAVACPIACSCMPYRLQLHALSLAVACPIACCCMPYRLQLHALSLAVACPIACCCMPRQACVRCAVLPVRGAETSPPLCVGACHTQVTLSVRTYYCRSDRGLLAPIHGAPSCMRVRVRARPVREWHMVCDRCSKTTQHGRTTEGGSFGAGKRRVSVLTQGVDQVHVPLPSVLPRGTRTHARQAHAIHASCACAGILANTLVWCQSLADACSMPR